MSKFFVYLKRYVAIFFDNSAYMDADQNYAENVDWYRIIPFILLHLACLGVFYVGVSATALAITAFTYSFRIFAIGAFYHRYFSHRAFKTNRFWQLVFAVLAGCSVQRGPLWWAAHHRSHHMKSDKAHDAHSPQQNSFLWSHMGWFLSRKNFGYPEQRIQDFSRYPELRFLDRYDVLVPLLFAISLFAVGTYLSHAAPHLHTNGWQVLVWGFFVSTILVFHVTFSVNSFAHSFGKQPYCTKDSSGNLSILALLTFGEGWHNNHHYYPKTARQGFQWWEIDITYYLIQLMASLGMVWDVKLVPESVKRARKNQGASALHDTVSVGVSDHKILTKNGK